MLISVYSQRDYYHKRGRRIKVGTFIRLEATNELYYVTAVNNRATFDNNSVDRVTQLTVSEGCLLM